MDKMSRFIARDVVNNLCSSIYTYKSFVRVEYNAITSVQGHSDVETGANG